MLDPWWRRAPRLGVDPAPGEPGTHLLPVLDVHVEVVGLDGPLGANRLSDHHQPVMRLMDALDDHDDVQNVYANLNVTDEMLAAAE